MNKRRASILLIFLFFSLAGYAVAQPKIPDIEKRVVRIFSLKKSAYYHKPWKSPDFTTVRASGFFFEDDELFPGMKGLILTNAHAVSMAESIKISNGREKRRYEVKSVGICNSADFAVLQTEPDDLRIYEERNGPIKPLDLGDSDTLRVGDKVTGWGYPLGGERISKSEEGEISRIEVNRYAYSQEHWLMVQASLQQNQGNSGGPVIKDGQVVGVAFQGMRAGDRINYFIPINLVRSLLPVLDRQELIPGWRYVVQKMFPRLKDYYNLSQDDGGVLLDYVIPAGGPYRFGLRSKDILMSIDGQEIDNFGDIYFKPLEQRIYFTEALNRKKVGDPIAFTVIRDGVTMNIEGTVTPGLPRLVSRIFTTANYFIFGGVGFVELTYNCIRNLGKSGATLRAKYLGEYPDKPRRKIVIISEVFPEYGLVQTSSYLKRVVKIDGEDILNIEDLYEKIQKRKAKGAKKALLELSRRIQIPIDFEDQEKLDSVIKEKYGILYMETPGGFRE